MPMVKIFSDTAKIEQMQKQYDELRETGIWNAVKSLGNRNIAVIMLFTMQSKRRRESESIADEG